MKQIPNIFTLLNLCFGCIAICFALQLGLITTYNTETGQQIIEIPEKLMAASLCIAIAAVIDFLDGFIARWLHATSELGKQLDSLSDVVSFGVAPGIIIYQFLRLSVAATDDGIDASMGWVLPAFILPCAGAYRLGRFNIQTNGSSSNFQGVPIPAVGLVVASFPCIYWYNHQAWVFTCFTNVWFWYACIAILSYLMVSTLPIKSLKFSSLHFRVLLPFLLVALSAIAVGFWAGFLCVPVAFLVYVAVSLWFK